MSWFNIISMEEFESWDGIIKKGEVINTITMNDLKEAKQWAKEQYGPCGENIKHKVIEVK